MKLFDAGTTVAKMMRRSGYIGSSTPARHVGGPVYVRQITRGEAAGKVEVMYARRGFRCTIAILAADIESDVTRAIETFVREETAA